MQPASEYLQGRLRQAASFSSALLRMLPRGCRHVPQTFRTAHTVPKQRLVQERVLAEAEPGRGEAAEKKRGW